MKAPAARETKLAATLKTTPADSSSRASQRPVEARCKSPYSTQVTFTVRQNVNDVKSKQLRQRPTGREIPEQSCAVHNYPSGVPLSEGEFPCFKAAAPAALRGISNKINFSGCLARYLWQDQLLRLPCAVSLTRSTSPAALRGISDKINFSGCLARYLWQDKLLRLPCAVSLTR